MPRSSLTRPADGKCARIVKRHGRPEVCGRKLPEERDRGNLTLGTDTCYRCASSARSLGWASREGKAWLEAWKARLQDLERDTLER